MPSRILTRFQMLLMLLVLVSAAESVQAMDDKVEKKEGSKVLELKQLFPEKSLFGPAARSTAFSADGRYASYLYRPRAERRHGHDLWIIDLQTNERFRLTDVSMMSKFQESSRKVRKHRIKAAKAAAKNKKSKEKGSGRERGGDKDQVVEEEEVKTEKRTDDELAMEIPDKDADDKKSPRYSGIRSYSWAPEAQELLIVSEGDIYRYKFSDKKLTRLTQTRARESKVAYLPDGSGYTSMNDSTLNCVKFGSHIVEQIDPKLPNGLRMSRYRLSPDGKRLAFIAYKQVSGGTLKKVNVISYRDRFAKVREIPRKVTEDKPTEYQITVYLYELDRALSEAGPLKQVFSRTQQGPRDNISTPEWAPDSSRCIFSVYNQEISTVRILEAKFESEVAPISEKRPAEIAKEAAEKAKKATNADDEVTDGEVADLSSKPESVKNSIPAAREVYRFLHYGGPNSPGMFKPEYMADSRRIVAISEQSGFRHLHRLDPLYQTTEAITQGRYEVYPVKISKDHKTLFVTATKEHPSRQGIYAIDLESGEMRAVSQGSGVYRSVAVSDNGEHALANFSSYGQLRELVRIHADGRQETLTQSHDEKAKKITDAVPEFFEYQNRHGHTIYGQMFKPKGWTADDKRPCLIYVYGGPLGRDKMVVDGSYSSDGYFFARYMAEKHGYLTCSIDPRGASGYGGMFEKANFERVGKPQVEDLVDGAHFLSANFGVDSKRIALHGWSFGGFQTQMCLYTAPDVFICGIAGAGPTEWENYNSWYSSGTIGKSREGKPDLGKYSLLPLAKNLKSKLLLVHGMEDMNVLYQDTVRVYRELLKAGKETLVELFLDPTGSHGLGGDIKRINKYRKYEEFLLRVVGKAAGMGAVKIDEPSKPEAKKETPKRRVAF